MKGTFDLVKFLTENKGTTKSRLVSEDHYSDDAPTDTGIKRTDIDQPGQEDSNFEKDLDDVMYKKGDTVKVPEDLTTDPYDKRGETGKIVHITADGTIVVEFKDGSFGLYQKNALDIIFNPAEETLKEGEPEKRSPEIIPGIYPIVEDILNSVVEDLEIEEGGKDYKVALNTIIKELIKARDID